MVKQDSGVKLSNLLVPCAGKESKAGCGYLGSCRVMPAYSREGIMRYSTMETKRIARF